MSFSPMRQRMPHGVLAARTTHLHHAASASDNLPPDARHRGAAGRSLTRAASDAVQHDTLEAVAVSMPHVKTALNSTPTNPKQAFAFTISSSTRRDAQEQQPNSPVPAMSATRTRKARPSDRKHRKHRHQGANHAAAAANTPAPKPKRRRSRRSPATTPKAQSGQVKLKIRSKATKKRDTPVLVRSPSRRFASPLRTTATATTMPALTSPTTRTPTLDGTRKAKPTALAQHLNQRSLAQWVRMYEQEHGTFQSTALEVETRMRRARAYGGEDDSPNHLLTAVTFEALGHLVSHFGAYSDLVREMLGALRGAVFVDAPGLASDISHMDPTVRHEVELYYDSIPYYHKCAELESSVRKLQSERDHMHERLKVVQQQAREEVERTKAQAEQHIKDSLLDASREKTLMIEQLKAATRALQTLKTKRAEESSVAAADSVRADFLRIPRNEQLAVVLEMLDQLGSDGNARLCMRVLKRLPGDTVVRVVSESMNAHTQVTLDHCQQVVDNIMHGKRAVGASDGSKKLVSGTVHRAMKSKERSTVVETAVSDLTNHQRQGLMRFLCNLDQSLLLRWKRNTINKGRTGLKTLTATGSSADNSEGKAGDADSTAGDGASEQDKQGTGDAAGRLVRGASMMVSSLSHRELLEVVKLSHTQLSDKEKFYFLRELLKEWGTNHAFQYTGRGGTAGGVTKQCDEGNDDAGRGNGGGIGAGAPSENVANGDASHSHSHASGNEASASGSLPLGSLQDLLTSLDPSVLASGGKEEEDEEDGHGPHKGKRRRRRKHKKGGSGGGGLVAKFGANHPMGKYLRRTKKSARQKLKIQNVLSLVYDCYEKKILADEVDDRERNPRDGFPEFMRDFLLHKYGLPSICDSYMFGIVDCLEKHMSRNPRLAVFSQLIGMSEQHPYLARAGDITLHLIKRCFTKFSASTLRMRKVGTCLVHIQRVLDAVEKVFPVMSVKLAGRVWNGEEVPLDEARYYELVQDIVASAFKYGEFAAVKRGRANSGDKPEGKKEVIETPKRRRSRTGIGKRNAPNKPDVDEDAFQSIDFVVDFDEVLRLALAAFWAQVHANIEDLKVLYHKCDEDGNGVLSLKEFKALVALCTNGQLRDKAVLSMFKQITKDQSDDTVSADDFALAVVRRGINPPPPQETQRRRRRSSVQLGAVALQHLRAVDAGKDSTFDARRAVEEAGTPMARNRAGSGAGRSPLARPARPVRDDGDAAVCPEVQEEIDATGGDGAIPTAARRPSFVTPATELVPQLLDPSTQSRLANGHEGMMRRLSNVQMSAARLGAGV